MAYSIVALISTEATVTEVRSIAAAVGVSQDVFILAHVMEEVLSLLRLLLPFEHIVSGSAVLESAEEGLGQLASTYSIFEFNSLALLLAE